MLLLCSLRIVCMLVIISSVIANASPKFAAEWLENPPQLDPGFPADVAMEESSSKLNFVSDVPRHTDAEPDTSLYHASGLFSESSESKIDSTSQPSLNDQTESRPGFVNPRISDTVAETD
eukprot:792532_1